MNGELERLETLLAKLPTLVAPGARAFVISFHSLEDRRVKHAFTRYAREGHARSLTRKPVVPDASELATNPRSRSAKGRAVAFEGASRPP